VLNRVIGYNVLDFTSEMDYKDTRLDKGRKHKGLLQVNKKHTRQLNFTRQIQRMAIQDGTIQVNK